jgi:hypothetical protein
MGVRISAIAILGVAVAAFPVLAPQPAVAHKAVKETKVRGAKASRAKSMRAGKIGRGKAPRTMDSVPPLSPPSAAGPGPGAPWPESVVAEAKAACGGRLAAPRYNVQPLPPIRDGVCGAPAPVLLKGSRGQHPLTFSPPAVVTCGLAETLDLWLETVVQPAARDLLHETVNTVLVAGSYDCRNRNHDPKQKLSNHALALPLTSPDSSPPAPIR